MLRFTSNPAQCVALLNDARAGLQSFRRLRNRSRWRRGSANWRWCGAGAANRLDDPRIRHGC
ncbi:MAG: hypothetical protein WBN76_12050, partial [Azonexus sp.]